MEEPPQQEPSSTSRSYQLILLSARTANALEQAAKNFTGYLKENPGVNLADAAYTLKVGRKRFEHKRMLVCSDIKGALEILESAEPEPHMQTHYEKEEKRAVFMFPGQGSQYVNMGLELYQEISIFREEMDRCFEILKPLMGYDIKEILYPGVIYRGGSPCPPSPGNSPLERGAPEGRGVSNKINQTEITQPVIFAIEYALAKLLMAWGIQPFAMIGHSIGEYVAACLSGVFSLEDALTVVSWRAGLMQQIPGGSMLGIPLPEQQLKPLLAHQRELDLAAVNGPSHCVVSGPPAAIDTFARQLEEKGQQCRKLHTSHAFHSRMMDPVMDTFREKAAQVKRHEPTIPFISNVTGQWITLEDAVDPGYWARHLRSPVRFADGLSELLKEKHSVFIEVGPGRTLSTFLRQHPDKQPGHQLVNLVRHPNEEESDEYYLLNKTGQIWLYGVPIDWTGFYAGQKRHRLHLPTYPFQRQPYWLEGNLRVMVREGILGRMLPGKKTDITQWFYMPSWKPSLISPVSAGDETGLDGEEPHKWLVFTEDNENELACQLVDRLKDKMKIPENDITVVTIGEKFTGPGKDSYHSYSINPGQEDDYKNLIDALHHSEGIPDKIIHLWNLTGGDTHNSLLERKRIEESLDRGFYSLLYLAKALGSHDFSHRIEIMIITNGMQEVWDGKVLYPEKAVVLGPLMVIPLEYPDIKCRCIDIDWMLPGSGDSGNSQDTKGVAPPTYYCSRNTRGPEEKSWNENKVLQHSNTKIRSQQLIHRLLKEMQGGINHGETVIAYRGGYRFVRTYEPAPLKQGETKPPRIKEGGVYLITGGLGGIGLVLARYLAKTVKAKLVLTGRSAFPAREEWEEWLNNHGSLDSTSQKIRSVKELEALGAEIEVYSIDAADEPGMRRVLEETQKRWGAVNGVIHSAGVPAGGVVQLKTREMADPVLAPKVKGTWVLNRVLQDSQPDFIMLCSSVNSVVPNIGQVDYFAGNAFLDAFAFYKNSVDNNPTFTVSINWDAWQEVGMAVEAARQSAGDDQRQTREPQPMAHPLLDHYTVGSQPGDAGKNVYTYTTYFSISRHWVLSEHRSKELNGIIPGVTYLEMACAALKNQVENREKQEGTIELREVTFFTPLIMAEGEEREARMVLEPKDEGYEFLVRSRVRPGDNRWENHALGKVALVTESPGKPKQYDLNAVEKRCNREEIDVTATWEPDAEGSLLIFGPRWENLKTVKNGEKEGLAFLELNEEFFTEPDQYTLYPSLLDTATSFLIGSFAEKPYIPYSYKKLRVYHPLSGRIYTYSRLVEDEDGKGSTDFMAFNIIIMDEQGRELVEVEEFTMMEISDEILRRLKAKEHGEIAQQGAMAGDAPGALPEPVEPGTGYDQLVKDGISPLEGVEAFTRILAQDLPQVVVSTRDLAALIKATQAANVLEQAAVRPGVSSQETLHSRPDISVPYVAPGSDIEQKMARIWQELLGIHQVGISDDFFELGGDSLKAAAMIAKIKQEFNTNISVRKIFNYPRIRDLTRQLVPSVQIKEEEAAAAAVKPLEKRQYYPVSSMQKRMYLLNRIEGIGTTYNLPIVVTIEEKLDIHLLEQTFQLLIRRHESLRTSFHIVEEEPVQVIHEPEAVDFHVEFMDHPDYQERDEEIEALVRGFIRPFDLTAAPLMRVEVVTLPGEKSLLIFDVHHIAVDGTSYMIIIKDFFTLVEDEGKLPRLKIQYKDFSGWLNSEAGTAVLKKQEAYWLDEFMEDIPVLNLPMDYPRPAVQVFNGSVVYFTITEEDTNRLKALALEENATLFMVLLGIFYVFLARLSSQQDIVVGSPAGGRRLADIQEVVGMFVNTLALRNYPVGQKNFRYFLKEVKERSLEALENQDYPFEILVENVSVRRDASRNPLFDVMFDFQSQLEKLGDPIVYPFEANIGVSKFDITFTVIEEKEYLTCHFEYCTRLFKKETMERYTRYLKKILSSILENPQTRLLEIDILSGDEKKQLLFDFNDTEMEFSGDKTLHELFERQVERTPNQLALRSTLDFSYFYEKSGDQGVGKYEGFCFRKNPYIFQYGNCLFLTTEKPKAIDKKEAEEIILLKTHQGNYVAVNPSLLSLLDYFNETTNLKSILNGLGDQKARFLVFNGTRNDECDPVTFQRYLFEISPPFNDVVPLIKTLAHVNLLVPSGYHLQSIPLDIRLNNRVKSDKRAKGTKKERRGPGPVLLLGDTPGPASTGLLYLAAYLRRHGIEAYCHWNDTSHTLSRLQENIETLLSQIRPGIVGISMKWFPHIARVFEIAKIVKTRDASVKVIVGGNTASYYSEQVIQNQWIDCVIRGDGEVPLLRISRGEDDVPNAIYKKNGKIISNPITYIQDKTNSADVFLSHLDEIFVPARNPYLASAFYINTGKGCSQQCFYCAGCREAQKRTFNRSKPFLRDVSEVRKDLQAAKPYTSTLMFDFDLPFYHANSIDYYRQIWEGIGLSNHFCWFYSWELPSPEFMELVTTTFNYVYFHIDLCSLSQSHRMKLVELGVVKPQPTDKELFAFFDSCEIYDNLDIFINQVAGLPYFTPEDIKKSHETLSRIIASYANFKGIVWGRLHAQPGAPITTSSETYDMHSYATTFQDFLDYSQRNLREQEYPGLKTLHYPYIYFNDEDLNSSISRFYFETEKQLTPIQRERKNRLVFTDDITYEKLDQQAEQVAGALRQRGVTPDSIVALAAKPSSDMAVGILGILKAGGAYLPIDPDSSPERITYMLADSSASVMVTTSSLFEERKIEEDRKMGR
jgi:acyl transferase domain-containing protein/acyl carrier protein